MVSGIQRARKLTVCVTETELGRYLHGRLVMLFRALLVSTSINR